ncbi:lactonase family protein [Lentibacillus daqui]|uniref:lactonase family protein n=1 Tax=Lentibacillus daqui TaxID=2911514 RepID=UPI0022B0FCE6|nr:lactonase family protein [Lentibacillus daqui]
MGKKYIGYAGTYTRQTSEGIYRFELDVDAGTLGKTEVAAKVGSPTYVTVRDDNKYLYSVAQDGDQGGVNAYRLENRTGALTKINSQLEDGAPPCHLTVRGDQVVTANYHKGAVGLYQVDEQGALQAGSFVFHEGSGPHKRQEHSHVHYAGFSPDGKYVLACDLGTDELVTYQIEDNGLRRVATLQVNGGSGPRHIVFHPNEKVAYLITELSSEIIVLAYDTETGSFSEKQYIKTIPADFMETNDASAIHISSDGKFVYAGNRGHNSITVFAVDDETNKLSLVEYMPSGGEWPRDFVLDPSENYLVASNQHTGNVVLFARDSETGKLSKLDSEIAVPEVVCVKFLQ